MDSPDSLLSNNGHNPETTCTIGFNQCIMHNTLDTGWVACGEKLNRSLCSLKIKLFLDAGGGDCGLFNAQLALDAGWVACGEKLNRSLCSLKIKLFLYAGWGDCGLFNAQLALVWVGRLRREIKLLLCSLNNLKSFLDAGGVDCGFIQCTMRVVRGTVLCFFSGKMDQEMKVFWSKTEVLGQFCVFFFNDN